MDTAIIILLAASAVLFILSFFRRDRIKELEQEVEQLSMNVLQENYQMKKRLKILEEELLVDGEVLVPSKPAVGVNEIIKNQVFSLYSQGLDTRQIARQSSLPLETVRRLIGQMEARQNG